MAHTATKITSGSYEYRGFTLRKSEHVCGGVFWFIDPDWDTKAPNDIDPASTLKEAKCVADSYLN